MFRDYTDKIDIDPAVRPCFCRARPVPYALQSLVERELDQLVQQGILEPVQFAEWAASIVPVLKADKMSVRICDDKMTVNQASQLDRYPIPKIDDLFAGMHGGRVFTKLDVSQATRSPRSSQSSTHTGNCIVTTDYHLGCRPLQQYSNKSWRISSKASQTLCYTSTTF